MDLVPTLYVVIKIEKLLNWGSYPVQHLWSFTVISSFLLPFTCGVWTISILIELINWNPYYINYQKVSLLLTLDIWNIVLSENISAHLEIKRKTFLFMCLFLFLYMCNVYFKCVQVFVEAGGRQWFPSMILNAESSFKHPNTSFQWKQNHKQTARSSSKISCAYLVILVEKALPSLLQLLKSVSSCIRESISAGKEADLSSSPNTCPTLTFELQTNCCGAGSSMCF